MTPQYTSSVPSYCNSPYVTSTDAIVPGIEINYNHIKRPVEPIKTKKGLKIPSAEKIPYFSNSLQDIRHLSDEIVPPASFDLVHARFLVSMLRPQEYPAILTSLVGRCRVGSLFAWDELEFPITTSPACQAFYALIQDGLKAAERAFSAGEPLGITAFMRNWIQEAGCRVTLDVASAIEISSGTKGRDVFAWQMGALSKQIRSFLLDAGVTTGAFFDELCSQAQREIFSDSFFGLIYVRTLVGERLK